MRSRPDFLQLRPDGTLGELGADDDTAPIVRDAATDSEGRPDGLLVEARACGRKRTSPRLPWCSRAARDVAAAVVGELGLAARTRRMLTRHVAATPYMEDGAVRSIVFVDDPEPGEPFGPRLEEGRIVWAAPLGNLRRAAVEAGKEPVALDRLRAEFADGVGPLSLPFASRQARDFWAAAAAAAGWPDDELARALERIAETPYVGRL